MKRVLITGASSDIGLSLVQKYQESDWFVIGHFRTDRPELNQFRGKQFADWCCNFSDISALEKDIKNNVAEISNVDAFVNLAASLTDIEFANASSTDILNTLGINLLPGLLIMQAIGPNMIQKKFGRIVHGSSIGTKFGGGKHSFAYSLSKHALEFIPQECRTWASNNVFINIARIGVTKTRMHNKIKEKDLSVRANSIPAKRLAKADEIAGALFWLASTENKFTTGEIISIAGGE